MSLDMSKMLKEMGFGTVLAAHRLSMAFELLRDNRIDLALLDYDLGYGERTTELGLALSESGAQVLFASGYDQSSLDVRLADYPFIEKPARTIALRERINDLIAQQKRRAQ